jgi:anti-sigma factor RsiW
MNCDDYQLRISAYVDGALAKEESAVLFVHLGGCEVCREFLRTVLDMHNAIAAARKARAPAILDKLHVTGLDTVPDVRSHGTLRLRQVWSRRFVVPMPAAAAVVALLIAGVFFSLSLWLKVGTQQELPKREVVYMVTLPREIGRAHV